MTDINDTHIVRSHAQSGARTILVAGVAAAQKLGLAIAARFNRPSFEDPRPRAERVRLAESLREEARRKVDRMMM